MRRASVWAACVGLLWSATSSAVPVYYTYGYFGEGRSYAAGDDASFRFTMEYDLDRQPTYLNDDGDLVTAPDVGLHTNPADPWYGHYQFDYFHATLAGTSEPLGVDLSAPNESTSFRQIAGPTPDGFEDVVRWESGGYFIQLIRYPGVVGAPLGSYFPFIADIGLGPTMVCSGRCGDNLFLLNVEPTHSIPEPATLGLLLVGAGLAASVRRKRLLTRAAAPSPTCLQQAGSPGLPGPASPSARAWSAFRSAE